MSDYISARETVMSGNGAVYSRKGLVEATSSRNVNRELLTHWVELPSVPMTALHLFLSFISTISGSARPCSQSDLHALFAAPAAGKVGSRNRLSWQQKDEEQSVSPEMFNSSHHSAITSTSPVAVIFSNDDDISYERELINLARLVLPEWGSVRISRAVMKTVMMEERSITCRANYPEPRVNIVLDMGLVLVSLARDFRKRSMAAVSPHAATVTVEP
ncbi:hypothetical protein Bbelb_096460 [Branchiostoma belcheri]|nr:hypothetical protein Bbelb_096460 [Branchiostoma belcheri]